MTGPGFDSLDRETCTAFYPYGQQRTSEGTLPTDKLYTGQQRETANGIYHYKARMYNADIGRMPQADGIRAYPLRPLAYNTYNYANNNPVNFVDPSGNIIISREDNRGVTCWSKAALVEAFPGTYFGLKRVHWGAGIECTAFMDWLNVFGLLSRWKPGTMPSVKTFLESYSSAGFAQRTNEVWTAARSASIERCLLACRGLYGRTPL
jgi:RHS repeat-associated protein